MSHDLPRAPAAVERAAAVGHLAAATGRDVRTGYGAQDPGRNVRLVRGPPFSNWQFTPTRPSWLNLSERD
jgi:hypothetical protein